MWKMRFRRAKGFIRFVSDSTHFVNRCLLIVFVVIKGLLRLPEGFHPDLDSKQSEPGGQLSANLASHSVDSMDWALFSWWGVRSTIPRTRAWKKAKRRGGSFNKECLRSCTYWALIWISFFSAWVLWVLWVLKCEVLYERLLADKKADEGQSQSQETTATRKWSLAECNGIDPAINRVPRGWGLCGWRVGFW